MRDYWPFLTIAAMGLALWVSLVMLLVADLEMRRENSFVPIPPEPELKEVPAIEVLLSELYKEGTEEALDRAWEIFPQIVPKPEHVDDLSASNWRYLEWSFDSRTEFRIMDVRQAWKNGRVAWAVVLQYGMHDADGRWIKGGTTTLYRGEW